MDKLNDLGLTPLGGKRCVYCIYVGIRPSAELICACVHDKVCIPDDWGEKHSEARWRRMTEVERESCTNHITTITQLHYTPCNTPHPQPVHRSHSPCSGVCTQGCWTRNSSPNSWLAERPDQPLAYEHTSANNDQMMIYLVFLHLLLCKHRIEVTNNPQNYLVKLNIKANDPMYILGQCIFISDWS